MILAHEAAAAIGAIRIDQRTRAMAAHIVEALQTIRGSHDKQRITSNRRRHGVTFVLQF
jgi:hypothetical protein